MTKDGSIEKRQQIRETYRYDEMSNKVLKADRSLHTVRTDLSQDAEQSQPKSMNGRISIKDMGLSARPIATEEEQEETKRQIEARLKRQQEQLEKTMKKGSNKRRYGNTSILDSDDLSRLRYYPTNATNANVYDGILEWTTDLLGNDMPHDIIMSAADLFIFTLKDKEDEADGMIDLKREALQKELSIVISLEKFQSLVKLTQRITDFEDTEKIKNDQAVAILADDHSEDENPLDEGQDRLQEGYDRDEDVDGEEEVTEAHKQESFEESPGNDLLQNLEQETVIYSGRKATAVETLPITEVDEFFLRRKVVEAIENAEASSIQAISDKIYAALEQSGKDIKLLEGRLMTILNFENLQLVEYIVKNKNSILWGIRISKCSAKERKNLFDKMLNEGLAHLVKQYDEEGSTNSKRDLQEKNHNENQKNSKRQRNECSLYLPDLVDLSAVEFEQGSKLMTVTKVELPEGSFKKVNEQYEEIHVPPPSKPKIDYDLVPISAFPEWARKAFPVNEAETLNVIQSKVFPSAFQSDVNLLICAPTGAGKTNVALMSILQVLSKYYDPLTNKLDTSQFKIVYIAPLKALVQEQVREFQRRLAYLGVRVEELTGDSSLNKHQISNTQILVSTPEKWDVITRKAGESFSHSELVRLIIIDEIHLLHDRRGPVIESIVARTFNSDVYSTSPRLVGLSATLPNYEDVAKFLRVPKEGLFYFDSSFRPCPLSQQFCGITEKSSLKKLNAMNEACFNKTLESVKGGHQVIIFVHSRKETGRTSALLRDMFIESENIEHIQALDIGSKQILTSEAENIQDVSFKKVVQHGIGIHHAGLSRSDRSLSEDLFADGLLKILVSTATLAWGVNLPAHTVIIKGTDLYSPEKGQWEQLSPQDLLQMLGRAGRPRYDTHGVGVIITSQADIQYYLAVLNQQLPIESQLISMLIDNLNAEIVSGNVKSRADAVQWLSYSYLYVRMMISPELYKVTNYEGDETLIKYRESLAHTAFLSLNEKNLIVYNAQNGFVESTELGRIASYFYIKFSSMAKYNSELTEHASQIDLFRIVAKSEEFKYITTRQEERRELKELFEISPIPLKEDLEDPLAKVNILLQSYISRLRFDGFALNADMNFITQNAGRLLRALYELALKKKLACVTKMLLNLCKMVERRMWNANSPLRQFPKCPSEVIRRTETSTIPWPDYLELQSPAEVGQTIRSEKHGKLVFDLIQKFPKIQLKCAVQPITPSLLKFELEVLPDWTWDQKLHGRMEQFVVLVEDTEGDKILFHDTILVKMENIGQDHILEFSLHLNTAQQKCLPPNFFVTVISERWLNCESQLAVKIENIHLPKKFPSPTQLLDVSLTSTSELQHEEFSDIFNFKQFNKFQSQVFQSIYNSNENVLFAASKGSGKTVIAELAVLNHWRQNNGRAIYISPYQERVNFLSKDWSKRFSNLAGGKNIGKLGSDLSLNLKVISQSHLILATPEQFNLVSRRWRQRKNLQKIELVIYDDVHEINHGLSGAVYEVLISRMAFITNQLENRQRVVALSSCLGNGRDFGEWLGVRKSNIFNFSPHERVKPIEIHMQAFSNVNNIQFDKPMTKHAFNFAHRNSRDPAIVFLPTRKSCIKIGQVFLKYAEEMNWDLLKAQEVDVLSNAAKIEDYQIGTYLMKGIGILYEGMARKDKIIIENLYHLGALSFLLLTNDCCFMSPTSAIVTILGTQYYDGRDHHFVNYSANKLLEMVGSTQNSVTGRNGKVLLITSSHMKEYYRKFLAEALPMESYMYFHLHDLFLTEIASSVIQSKQDCIDWVTYTYFYRRLHSNPSFYGVRETSAYGISAYLTELVENTLHDLEKSSLIEISQRDTDEDEKEQVSPLNGCLISSHYNISFLTMHTFLSNLSGGSTLEDILQLLSRASEFEQVSINEGDRSALFKLHSAMPLKGSVEMRMDILSYKVFILLQAYFSRINIPSDFQIDLKVVLEKAIPLINAVVDILSGDGRLNALTAMDISQMIIQGVWDTDSPLKQVPYFDQEVLKTCSDMKIETIFDIMALEDSERERIMTMDNSKLIKVATFINNYPNIELTYDLQRTDKITADETNVLSVTLTRDEAPETLEVTSSCYPFEKLENWWLVLGEVSSRELLAIKKISLRQESQNYQLEFKVSNGNRQLTLWCVCDSYLDADKEVSFDIKVV